MPSLNIKTTQNLQATPELVTDYPDSPSGTFTVHRLTISDTSFMQAGGKVILAEGVNSEEVILIQVEDSTHIYVEQLVNSYTTAGTLTFIGRTNPGDPRGTTVVKNATGKSVNGSINKAEFFWNPVIKDVKTLWNAILNNLMWKDGSTKFTANIDFDKFQALNLILEALASDPTGGGLVNGRVYYRSDAHNLAAVINGAAQLISTVSYTDKLTPVGTVIPYSAASGYDSYYWILAQGQTKNRTGDFAALYALIGTTWGSGDGSGNTFSLPKLSGRTLVGTGTGSGLTARTLGQYFGAEEKTLSISNIPSHDHSYTKMTNKDSVNYGSGTYTYASTTSADTGNTGSGSPFNIMQPSAAINFLIRYR